MSDLRAQFRRAAYILVTRQGVEGTEILLGQRINTSWGDGAYFLPAGHVEMGQTAEGAAEAELEQETGLTLAQGQRLEPVLSIDFFKDYGKPDGWRDDLPPEALCAAWEKRAKVYAETVFRLSVDGTHSPVNREPDKCADLRFFPLAQLPDNTHPLVRHVLACVTRGVHHTTYGWDTDAARDFARAMGQKPPRVATYRP